MATFSGRNSPTALAALAPSINNLAAAKRAKSQAAAGLMNTLGVQFEKQKQQTAKREQNEAAQQVAEKLLQDPAFRRQAPGITDSASLVKLVGAENVIGYGMKTQEADRVAQQSAANIGLIKKQIEQYDIDAKQREADEASSKALTTLVGGMYGEGFTQKDLITGLQGLSSGDAVRAVNIYNERNPGEMLEQRTIGGRTFVYNTKTGATFDLGTGSELDKETESRIAAINQMNIPEEQKEEMIQQALNYAATPRDRDGYPIDGFGGQPAGGAAGGAGPVLDASPEAVSFFQQIPEDRVTDVFLKDGQTTPEFDQYLSKLSEAGVSDDIISGVKTMVEQRAEEDRMGRFARGEFGEKKPGFFERVFGGGESSGVTRTRRGGGDSVGLAPVNQQLPSKDRIAARRQAAQVRGLSPTSAAPTTPPDPRLLSIQQARAIQESPISAPTTSRSAQEIIGEARAIQGLPSEVQLQDRALKQRQAAFDNAKELARQELAKKLSGPERDKVLKELEDARIDEIMSLKGKSAQTKTQKKVREALLKILRGPEFIRKYGIDELPGKLIDLIPDMRTKRERERLERLEKQQSK